MLRNHLSYVVLETNYIIISTMVLLHKYIHTFKALKE